MFSTETSGILCIVSLESYLGKPLNIIYEIEKKYIYPTPTKKVILPL